MQTPDAIARRAGRIGSLIAAHPDAISFASGRPPSALLPAEHARYLDRYVEHEAARTGDRPARVRRALGQYASPRGIIGEHLRRHLAVSGLGDTSPEASMVTAGAQDAITLCLLTLARGGRICVSADPIYFGLISAAQTVGAPLETLPGGPRFVDRLEARLTAPGGPPVGLVYVIPDFDNPTGWLMPLADRERLVALAEQHRFHILEDAVYRHFRYEGPPLPTLASLDRADRVIYVESFSKTVLPGLRLAAVATAGAHPDGGRLIDHLARAKAALSVTASPLAQAILAGFLIEHEHRLTGALGDRVERLRQNRDALVAALRTHLPDHRSPWPAPRGGFYLCVDPGAPMTLDDVARCAADAQVLLTPLSLFSVRRPWPHHIRLAFSNMDPATVEEGIARWAGYLRQRGARPGR